MWGLHTPMGNFFDPPAVIQTLFRFSLCGRTSHTICVYVLSRLRSSGVWFFVMKTLYSSLQLFLAFLGLVVQPRFRIGIPTLVCICLCWRDGNTWGVHHWYPSPLPLVHIRPRAETFCSPAVVRSIGVDGSPYTTTEFAPWLTESNIVKGVHRLCLCLCHPWRNSALVWPCGCLRRATRQLLPPDMQQSTLWVSPPLELAPPPPLELCLPSFCWRWLRLRCLRWQVLPMVDLHW